MDKKMAGKRLPVSQKQSILQKAAGQPLRCVNLAEQPRWQPTTGSCAS
jgi:hypothetical protein